MVQLFVVMGVSGAGKSTLASALAEHYGFLSLDADDFHSEQAKAYMAAGNPLTDEMRQPWIARLCRRLTELSRGERHLVLAFSGLKQSHREPLRHCGLDTHFLFLDGTADMIAERVRARQKHFMSPQLVDSQFEALERPDPRRETDVRRIDITPTAPGVLAQAIELVDALAGSAPPDT